MGGGLGKGDPPGPTPIEYMGGKPGPEPGKPDGSILIRGGKKPGEEKENG